MSSTKLINLHRILSIIIISSTSSLSKVIVIENFTEHRNFLLGTSDLAIRGNVLTNNTLTIKIYDQAFVSLSNA